MFTFLSHRSFSLLHSAHEVGLERNRNEQTKFLMQQYEPKETYTRPGRLLGLSDFDGFVLSAVIASGTSKEKAGRGGGGDGASVKRVVLIDSPVVVVDSCN
jgi:hypothetical protein